MEPNGSEKPETLSPPKAGAFNLETASKLVAAFAVVLYGCGLLITSISYSRYGFLDMNPLRPRPVLAGAWFVSFCAASYALLKGTAGLKPDLKNPEVLGAELSRIAISYCIGCGALTSGVGFFFDFPAGTSNLFGWKFYLAAAILFVLDVLALEKKLPQLAAVVPSAAFVVLVGVIAIGQTLVRGRFCDSSLFLWFSVACMVIPMITRVFSTPRIDSWLVNIFLILMGLLIFAKYYYPHLNTSWGGGAPIPVVIYMNKDAAVASGKISAMLIEDSDAGLYIVIRGDKKATFLPRSAVTMVYFSGDASTLALQPAGAK
jgi:hypothetical protein